MDILNTNLLDNENSDLLNVNYYEKHYGASGDSESEAEGEQEYENEDYADYENEESEIDTTNTDLPKFRTLVRQKKLELKSQYGKAHIENHSTTERECKIVPVPTTCYKTVSIPYPCVKNLKPTTCYKDSSVPYPCMRNQEVCVNVPKIRFVWVSGWRKKWREFKRDGGLAQLRLQSQGLYVPPTFEPTPTPDPTVSDSLLSCQELADKYGIIAGQSFGTAPMEVINDWRNRNCRIPSVETTELNETETKNDNGVPKPKQKPSSSKMSVSDDKILGMPKDVAVGLGVAVALIGGFIIYKKFIAK